eukprot:1412272-Prymnesium_polylepis.1
MRLLCLNRQVDALTWHAPGRLARRKSIIAARTAALGGVVGARRPPGARRARRRAPWANKYYSSFLWPSRVYFGARASVNKCSALLPHGGLWRADKWAHRVGHVGVGHVAVCGLRPVGTYG